MGDSAKKFDWTDPSSLPPPPDSFLNGEFDGEDAPDRIPKLWSKDERIKLKQQRTAEYAERVAKKQARIDEYFDRIRRDQMDRMSGREPTIRSTIEHWVIQIHEDDYTTNFVVMGRFPDKTTRTTAFTDYDEAKAMARLMNEKELEARAKNPDKREYTYRVITPPLKFVDWKGRKYYPGKKWTSHKTLDGYEP